MVRRLVADEALAALVQAGKHEALPRNDSKLIELNRFAEIIVRSLIDRLQRVLSLLLTRNNDHLGANVLQ